MSNPQKRENQPHLEYLLLLLVGVASLFLFWFFRTNGWTGGDSEQWEREVTSGIWFRRRQMLSFASMQLSYQIMNGLFHWSGMMAIGLISALSGAIGSVIIWLMVREQPRRWLLLLLVITSGWTAIWYGHIETYAQPAAALLLHLLAIQRYTEGRWPIWGVTLSWAFFLSCHLVAAFTFPALLFFLWTKGKGEGIASRYWKQAALGFLPTMLLLILISLRRKFTGDLVDSYTAGHWQRMVLEPWTIWEAIKVPLKLSFAWWNGGLMAIAAVYLAMLAFRKDRAALDFQLAVYFLCFIVYTILWDPHRGETDWDLYTFPWIVGSILVARNLTTLPVWKVSTAAILLANALLLTTRPIAWSEFWQRGTGSILIREDLSNNPPYIYLLNDRTHIDNALYYVPIGENYVRIIDIRSGADTMVPVIINRNELLTLLIQDEGIMLMNEGGEFQ